MKTMIFTNTFTDLQHLHKIKDKDFDLGTCRKQLLTGCCTVGRGPCGSHVPLQNVVLLKLGDVHF